MSNQAPQSTVAVTDIRMPFWSMVRFMCTWALASIPAMFILGLAAAGVWMLVAVAAGVASGLRVGQPTPAAATRPDAADDAGPSPVVAFNAAYRNGGACDQLVALRQQIARDGTTATVLAVVDQRLAERKCAVPR